MAEKASSVKSAASEKSQSSSSEDTILAPAESKRQPNIYLDVGEEQVRFRTKWWQIWYFMNIYWRANADSIQSRIPRDPPAPPRASLSDAPVHSPLYPVFPCPNFRVDHSCCDGFLTRYIDILLGNTFDGRRSLIL